jgi:hypothetical protein
MKRIENLIQPVSKSPRHLRGIDGMYETIMLEAEYGLEPDERDILDLLLMTIMNLNERLSVTGLSHLLDGCASEAEIQMLLSRLSPVIDIPAEGAPVTIFHPSFIDFLNEEYLRDRYNQYHAHHSLLAACFTVMNNTLRFNVSKSRSSFLPNPKGQSCHIGQATRYACRSWSHHLDQLPSLSIDVGLLALIHTWLKERLLFWLEVGSLEGTIGDSLRALSVMEARLSGCSSAFMVCDRIWLFELHI